MLSVSRPTPPAADSASQRRARLAVNPRLPRHRLAPGFRWGGLVMAWCLRERSVSCHCSVSHISIVKGQVEYPWLKGETRLHALQRGQAVLRDLLARSPWEPLLAALQTHISAADDAFPWYEGGPKGGHPGPDAVLLLLPSRLELRPALLGYRSSGAGAAWSGPARVNYPSACRGYAKIPTGPVAGNALTQDQSLELAVFWEDAAKAVASGLIPGRRVACDPVLTRTVLQHIRQKAAETFDRPYLVAGLVGNDTIRMLYCSSSQKLGDVACLTPAGMKGPAGLRCISYSGSRLSFVRPFGAELPVSVVAAHATHLQEQVDPAALDQVEALATMGGIDYARP